MRLEALGASHNPAVQRMLHARFNGDNDGLIHLVADHLTLAQLASAAGGDCLGSCLF